MGLARPKTRVAHPLLVEVPEPTAEQPPPRRPLPQPRNFMLYTIANPLTPHLQQL